jgi:hypothetical protein
MGIDLIGRGENRVPTPVDYSNQETERDVYTLDSSDPLFSKKSFDKPAPKRPAPPPPPRPKPAPASPVSDLPSSYYEANGESYLRARRVAEMKFNTFKLILSYAVVSAGLLAIDFFLYEGVWWCHWPIGFWALIIAFPTIKSFVFRGKDIRSVIESRLHKMALREVERFDTDLDRSL